MRLIDKQEVRLIESDADAYPQEWNNDYEKGFCDAIHKVLELPTIDAQPVKQGKWSEYSRNALETYIECTNCCVASRPIHLQMVTRNGSGLPDYCPNCGAKMGGGDADETE